MTSYITKNEKALKRIFNKIYTSKVPLAQEDHIL